MRGQVDRAGFLLARTGIPQQMPSAPAAAATRPIP